MSDSSTPKSGELAATLATWLYLLAEAGHQVADEDVRAGIFALFNPAPDQDPEALGKALADAISAWLRAQLGADHIQSFEEGSREERLRAARAWQFQSSLPWLARMLSRFPDGTVGSHWVMVERITDTVSLADPFPWDDLDEEYQLDPLEFMVKWELGGLVNLRWQAA